MQRLHKQTTTTRPIGRDRGSRAFGTERNFFFQQIMLEKKISKYPDFKTWASIPHIIYTSKFKIDHRVGDAAL